MKKYPTKRELNKEANRHFQPSKNQPKNGYVCIGSVRGWCGTVHTRFEAAIRCREKDQKGCEKQGGYSDRTVRKLKDGTVGGQVLYRIVNGRTVKVGT